eukprot:15453404-Alexandrium_andersonii.AAC.1
MSFARGVLQCRVYPYMPSERRVLCRSLHAFSKKSTPTSTTPSPSSTSPCSTRGSRQPPSLP